MKGMSRVLDYSMLDVFAERPLEGNALAVFHDGSSLSDQQMQAIAREMRLSETTFIIPGDPEMEARDGVRVRIFTTEEELPFAGHPTLGTAAWLRLHHPRLRQVGTETVTLRLRVGPVPVRFAPEEDGVLGLRATMLQNDPVFGATHDRAEVANLIGLSAEDLSSGFAPQTVSTGMPFCIVLLRSLGALQRMQLAHRQAAAWLAGRETHFFYCIAPVEAAPGVRLGSTPNEPTDGHPRWRARMQFYSGEDPATGSAAGCCIAWLVKHGLARSEQTVEIEQGAEIRRPSRIVVRAAKQGDRVHAVEVSGRTIPVAEGRLFLP